MAFWPFAGANAPRSIGQRVFEFPHSKRRSAFSPPSDAAKGPKVLTSAVVYFLPPPSRPAKNSNTTGRAMHSLTRPGAVRQTSSAYSALQQACPTLRRVVELLRPDHTTTLGPSKVRKPRCCLVVVEPAGCQQPESNGAADSRSSELFSAIFSGAVVLPNNPEFGDSAELGALPGSNHSRYDGAFSDDDESAAAAATAAYCLIIGLALALATLCCPAASLDAYSLAGLPIPAGN